MFFKFVKSGGDCYEMVYNTKKEHSNCILFTNKHLIIETYFMG